MKKQNTIVYSLVVLGFLLLAPKCMFAASIGAFSDKASAEIGEQFSVVLRIDSDGASINAAQTTVQFPKDIVEITSVEKSDSVFNFWLEEPQFSNQNGTLSFTAGSANGFNGKSLQVLRIVFRVKQKNPAAIILNKTAITLADGTGSNVFKAAHGATINAPAAVVEVPSAGTPPAPVPAIEQIIPVTKPVQIVRIAAPAKIVSVAPVISVPLYPEAGAWSNASRNFLVSWDLPRDVTAVATAITKDPAFSPTVSEGLFDNKIFPALDDGIWYLHVRFKNNIGWGTTAHYKIAVDTLPPTSFTIAVREGNPSSEPNPTISYALGDQLAEIEHYSIRIDTENPIDVRETSYTLPLLAPGDHVVSVTAVDRAQNSTQALINLKILPIAAPILDHINGVFVGEGNLYVSGTALPSSTVLVTLRDGKKQLVKSLLLNVNRDGAWLVRIDDPLKKETYRIEVVARDDRGALSFPVGEDIIVRERPLITVLGVGITQVWFFTFTSILLIGAFIGGLLLEKRKKESRGRRITLAESDIGNMLVVLKKDLSKLDLKIKDAESRGEISPDIRFLATRMTGHIKKIEDYILLGSIEELKK